MKIDYGYIEWPYAVRVATHFFAWRWGVQVVEYKTDRRIQVSYGPVSIQRWYQK